MPASDPASATGAEANRLAAWNARWSDGRTTWHHQSQHPALQKHSSRLELSAKSRVLVPLCGKSVDLRFFAEAGVEEVVGVDGVQLALDEFVAEQDASVESTEETACGLLHKLKIGGANLTFVVGDFFHLTPSIFAPQKFGTLFNAAFDRGGLVAVEPSDRARYVDTLARNVGQGGRVLLVTTEHSPFNEGKLGPPFSIEEKEIREILEGGFDVELLEREDKIDNDPIWRQRGCTSFCEAIYLLTRNAEPT